MLPLLYSIDGSLLTAFPDIARVKRVHLVNDTRFGNSKKRT